MSEISERVNIQGPISNSQIAIGDHNIQLQNLTGVTVNITSADQRPIWERSKKTASSRPRPPRLFLDRTAEVQMVNHSVQAFQPVSLDGVAGFGKSTLLRQLSFLLRPGQYRDGIHHLPALRLKMEDLLQDIFSIFYTSNQPALPNRAQLQDLLQEINAVLLIDDVDLNPDELQVMLDLLPNCMFVIAATQQVLQSGFKTIQLGGLPESDAIALFESQLERALNENERQIVCEISELLLGHPESLFCVAATTHRDGLNLAEVQEKLTGLTQEAKNVA
ncbi:MAG: hypothetical protein ACM3XO_00275 [Bacteroidota bacterium]